MALMQRQQVASCSSRCKAFAPARPTGRVARASVVVKAESQPELNASRRDLLSTGAAIATSSALSPLILTKPALANKPISSEWELVDLPLEKGVVLLDIGFTGSDPNHGFLLGTRQTLLETFDGGKTWEPRSIEAAKDEGFNYRFNSISFSGSEGWIVGKPAILLHTSDAGKSWERIPLSAKLPGVPLIVKALPGKAGQAEMTTDQGAIYVTDNTAYTWQAAVQETVDATLNRTVSSGITGASYYEGYFSNIARSESGDYVAVSSRGNFFMSWEAGQAFWQPHNRPTARRLQNMGWTPDNRLWVTTRGGDVLVADQPGVAEKFGDVKLNSRGFGILDVGFRDNNKAFAVGGSGSLYKSEDGGRSWKRDKGGDDVPANLYAVRFFNGGSTGFILGNDAILLRYIGA
mmetsp:Transcript_25154/g.63824  ORF Transcript_25154/g.63824 Transcript_25154/m.63824 type:complete len:405 (-) Transcript_25154:716-1930(-)|eukprot:CAMPEP_0202865104 /NCGR_PEP_ID=MMETSP1391-20130828/5260_1 /ASSEMBLY_ACC=CAM_ASM_000867 /TAXON_ID=1034604 /ORGANISM="Chlamydomonas leiostraca, Strain SAG 11-49" /LENGTH=404 /DNA_ID=CAMNT_0049544903 /DNA_START=27 /DNA_END=1241 /DNA_ORIENTATION=+